MEYNLTNIYKKGVINLKIHCFSIITALIIVCSLLLTGCACTSGDKQPEVQSSTEQSTSEQTTESIGSDKMYEFETQELCCKKGDQNIYGQVYIPQTENNSKLPAVIIGHGFGGTYIKKAL